MEIQEATAKKTVLEKKIAELLQDFEDETGLWIGDTVHIKRLQSFGRNFLAIQSAEILVVIR